MNESQPNRNTMLKAGDLDLRKFVAVIKKWRYLIIALTILCPVVAGLISNYLITPVYEAKTLLMVTVASEKLQTQTTVTRQTTQNSQGATVTNLASMPVLTMNTYLGQLKSEAVMNRVADSLAMPGLTAPKLPSMITAAIVTDSNLIEVRVRNTDPAAAAKIANTVSEQYLKLMGELMFSSVVVISPANIPPNPMGPNTKLNIMLAFILGLMGSIMFAFVLDYLDNTLKTPDDIARELNLPVLGLIPVKNAQNTRQNT